MSPADHAELQTLLVALEADDWPEEFAAAREFYDAWGTPVAADIAVTEHHPGGVPSYLATPPGADPTRIGLWLHGGGYVYGSQRSHGSMIAEVARVAGFAITHLQYRRAPENPYPAALEDAVAAYRGLLGEGWDPQAITLSGDSAGGGLVLALLLYLRDHGVPLPAAAACISPWVDLEGTGESFTANDEIDPLMVVGEEVAVPAISRMMTGVAPGGRMLCESTTSEKWLPITELLLPSMRGVRRGRPVRCRRPGKASRAHDHAGSGSRPRGSPSCSPRGPPFPGRTSAGGCS